MLHVHKNKKLVSISLMNRATSGKVAEVIYKNPDCLIQASLSWEQRSKAAILLELGFIGTGWAKRKERMLRDLKFKHVAGSKLRLYSIRVNHEEEGITC